MGLPIVVLLKYIQYRKSGLSPFYLVKFQAFVDLDNDPERFEICSPLLSILDPIRPVIRSFP